MKIQNLLIFLSILISDLLFSGTLESRNNNDFQSSAKSVHYQNNKDYKAFSNHKIEILTGFGNSVSEGTYSNKKYSYSEFMILFTPKLYLKMKSPSLIFGRIKAKYKYVSNNIFHIFPTPNRNTTYYFGGHANRNWDTFGFSLGVYIISYIPSEVSAFPLPYASIRFGIIEKFFYSISIFDIFNFLPYSIGINFKYKRIFNQLSFCLLKKNKYYGSIIINYNFIKNINLISQILVSNYNSFINIRVGFGYQF